MEPLRAPSDRAPRVLLAEDHAGARQAAELLLREAGAAVTSVAHGLEVVDAFASQAFDLILIGARLPAMGAAATIRAVRRQETVEQRPRTRICLLAADGRAFDAARRAGADAWLARPLTPEALSMVLDTAIAKVCVLARTG